MERLDFNKDWFFYKSDNMDKCQRINLPHDAMILEERDPTCKNGKGTGYFPGGKYLYVKNFYVPHEWKDKTLILEFEGVYQNTTVKLNGKKLLFRPNGYVNFLVELTEQMVLGKDNVLEVIVDNSGEPGSRWYSGSGIYRPVWLYIGEKECIKPDSIRIQTRSYAPAILNIKTEADGDVHIRILDGDVEVACADGADVDITIPNAKLWCEETPNLYACQVELYKDGKLVDKTKLNCGVCKIQWSTGGLFVNGVETKLRGACIHHDNGILGACEFSDAALRRVCILKKAGFNAIRSAHNPISREMLEACDKVGLYVMDEFSDMWYEHKNRWDYALWFEEWHERDLSAMIRKDCSHPSVIMYSIGNEVTETSEEWGIELTKEMTELVHSLDDSRPVTCGINMALNTMHFAGLGVYKPEADEPPKREQKKNPKAMALLAEMMKAKGYQTQDGRQANATGQVSTDKAGYEALGMQSGMGNKQDGKLVGSEYFNKMMMTMKEQQRQVVTQPIAKILSEDAYAQLDIAGYNYADGRYENDAEDYPNRISVGTETLPQRIFKNWRLVQKLPYIIGDFMWTGWDYIGEAGVGAFCYDSVGTKDKEYPALLAGSGVIDITGQQRPEVWLNKIVFGIEKGPYIGVEPVTHSHEGRLISAWRYSDAVRSWSWAGCEGKKAELIVYADAVRVEIFLNGQLIDAKPVEECQAKFETVYQPGELMAISYNEDGIEVGRDILRTAGRETVINVQADKKVLAANGQDLCYVDIALADVEGIIKTSKEQVVTVDVEGAGTLAGLGNANPYNEESYQNRSHKTYYGKVQAVIRSGYEPGEIGIVVSTSGCVDKKILLQVI